MTEEPNRRLQESAVTLMQTPNAANDTNAPYEAFYVGDVAENVHKQAAWQISYESELGFAAVTDKFDSGAGACNKKHAPSVPIAAKSHTEGLP